MKTAKKKEPTFADLMAEDVRRGNFKSVLSHILFLHALWLQSDGKQGRELNLSPAELRRIAPHYADILLRYGFPATAMRSKRPPPEATVKRRFKIPSW